MGRHYIKWSDEQIEQLRNDIIPDGKNYAQCSYYCRVHLGKGFRPIRNPQHDDRGKEYTDMYYSGMTYTEIASKVGLSRQRVCAIVQRWVNNHKGY